LTTEGHGNYDNRAHLGGLPGSVTVAQEILAFFV
jgi:hypothetical protein